MKSGFPFVVQFFFIFLILSLGFSLVPKAYATTIKGEIYDLSFELNKNAIVEINTTPKQQKIAAEGTYEFQVPQGTYILKASVVQGNEITESVEEEITVAEAGEFRLDLLLFPDVEIEMEILKDIQENDNETLINENLNIVEDDPKENIYKLWLILALVLLVLALGLRIRYKIKQKRGKEKNSKGELTKKESKKRNPEEKNTYEEEKKEEKDAQSPDLKKYVDYLKKEKRTTQKEMRKQFPDSEAKISLVLTELESQGKIQKIKRGRANVIIWKG